MIDRLKEDHRNARHLADSLAELEGIKLNPSFVKTNIIIFNFNHPSISSKDLVSHMKSKGIIFNNYNEKHCRLVTHHDISSDDIENVIDVFNKLLS